MIARLSSYREALAVEISALLSSIPILALVSRERFNLRITSASGTSRHFTVTHSFGRAPQPFTLKAHIRQSDRHVRFGPILLQKSVAAIYEQ
jgi:hypothetical protein